MALPLLHPITYGLQQMAFAATRLPPDVDIPRHLAFRQHFQARHQLIIGTFNKGVKAVGQRLGNIKSQLLKHGSVKFLTRGMGS